MYVSVSKRAYMSREDLETFGFTARCIGCLSIFKGTARQAHTKGFRRRIEGEMPDTVEAEAVQRRVKEYQDKAVERATKRTESSREETQVDTSTKSSSSSGGAALASSSSGSGDAA